MKTASQLEDYIEDLVQSPDVNTHGYSPPQLVYEQLLSGHFNTRISNAEQWYTLITMKGQALVYTGAFRKD